MLTSRQINEGLEKLSDDDRSKVIGLDDTGKSVPYIGWFWREVDFDDEIDIGCIPDKFAGFMVNNKWDHPERSLDSEQSSEVRRICEDLVQETRAPSMTALFIFGASSDKALKPLRMALEAVEIARGCLRAFGTF